MPKLNHIELLVKLAGELGCALEMYATPDEIQSPGWKDAIDALKDVRHILGQEGIPTPGVVENVLNTANGLSNIRP